MSVVRTVVGALLEALVRFLELRTTEEVVPVVVVVVVVAAAAVPDLNAPGLVSGCCKWIADGPAA